MRRFDIAFDLADALEAVHSRMARQLTPPELVNMVAQSNSSKFALAVSTVSVREVKWGRLGAARLASRVACAVVCVKRDARLPGSYLKKTCSSTK